MKAWYCPHQYGYADAYAACISCRYRSAEMEDGAVLSHSYGALIDDVDENERNHTPSLFWVDAQAYACNAPEEYVCPTTKAVKEQRRKKHEEFMSAMVRQYGSEEAYYEMLHKAQEKEEQEKLDREREFLSTKYTLTRGNQMVTLQGETFEAFIDLSIGKISEEEFQAILKRNGAVWKEVLL